MCGIAGIFGINCETEKINMMLNKMKHRGTADCRAFPGREHNFHYVHLSSNDEDGQPVYNETGSLCIAFHGRIYNYEKLRSMLNAKHTFSTDTDAELVLHLYEERGVKCASLLDGIFAFAVYDAEKGLFLARDPLGIKPLYISDGGENIYFASEMKALVEVAPDFIEFPIGSYYQAGKGYKKYFSLSPVAESIETMDEAIEGINNYLKRAVQKRLVSDRPFGVYLSGGLDSSIIAALTVQDIPGIDSFAVGMEGSKDITHARLCADYLGTNHHEYIYDLDEMLEVLPQVIYHLESYDAALVRSSVANYFLARLACEDAQVVFSGEGADELFCGYQYFQKLSEEDLHKELFDLMGTLHNTGLQRGDRMSMAYGVEARVPFLDMDFVRFAFTIPLSMKIGPENQEKWVLRKAFSDILPDEILYRKKNKFSVGAGSFLELSNVAEQTISDEEFAREAITPGGHRIKNKEELMYYRIFREYYPEIAVEKAIDFSRSL